LTRAPHPGQAPRPGRDSEPGRPGLGSAPTMIKTARCAESAEQAV